MDEKIQKLEDKIEELEKKLDILGDRIDNEGDILVIKKNVRFERTVYNRNMGKEIN